MVTKRHGLWFRHICISQVNGSLLCSTDWMICGGWGGGGQRELKEGEPSVSLHWVMMCSILPSLWEALGWVSTSQQSRPSNSACSGPQPPPHSTHTYNTHTCSRSSIHSLSLFFWSLFYLLPGALSSASLQDHTASNFSVANSLSGQFQTTHTHTHTV